MPGIDYALRIAIQAVDRFSGPMGKINKKLQGIGQSTRRVGRDMTFGLTMPAILAGTAIFRTAAAFEAQMLEIQGLRNLTDKQFNEMETLARDLGRTTVFTATQVGDAMKFMAIAGFEHREIIQGIPHALNLAAAANIDFGQAADIVTNIMKGFRLEMDEVEHVTDVLVEGFTSSNTNLLQLGEGMKYVATLASGFNVPLEQMVSMMGTLGDAGIQSSMAGTSLRRGLASFVTLTGDAVSVMKQLNIAKDDVFDPKTGKGRPFLEILDRLGKAGVDAEDAIRIFQLRAGPGMNALFAEGLPEVAAKAEKLTSGVHGRAAQVAAVRMKGATGSLREFAAAAEGAAIDIGKAGFLGRMTTVIRAFAAFTRKINQVNPATIDLITKIVLIGAAIGPVVFAVGALVGAVALLINPLTWIVAGIGVVVGAFWYYRDEIDAAMQSFGDSVEKQVDRVYEKFNDLGEFLKRYAQNVKDIFGFGNGRALLDLRAPAGAGLPGRGGFGGPGGFAPASAAHELLRQRADTGGQTKADVRVRFENTPRGTDIYSDGTREALNLDVGYAMGAGG